MVTIKDIAKAAGVSYATVSRALNDVTGTKDSTSKRIKELAATMGYRKNVLASSLVTQQSNTVGFILPDLGNPFFTKILRAMTQEADRYNQTVLVCDTDWDSEREHKELKTLAERRVDGILLYPSSDVDDDRLKEIPVPTVVFGKVKDEDMHGAALVEVDNDAGGRIALEHMLACGYRRVAYVGGWGYSASNADRRNGIEEAAGRLRYRIKEEWISSGAYTILSGYERTQSLLALGKNRRPDGLICGNDLIALGAMQAISEAGLIVGEDIGVIGFDDVPYASLPQIQLTTVRIPCEDMGRAGMRLLMNLTEKRRKQMTVQGERILLYPELVQRKSTKGGRR